MLTAAIQVQGKRERVRDSVANSIYGHKPTYTKCSTESICYHQTDHEFHLQGSLLSHKGHPGPFQLIQDKVKKS